MKDDYLDGRLIFPQRNIADEKLLLQKVHSTRDGFKSSVDCRE